MTAADVTPPVIPAGHGDMWVDVCAVSDLIVDRGVCARVSGEHVALFLLADINEVYAIGNVDPFSGASVLSRGIVGDRGGVPKVASPVYKQSFDLRTGVCLDNPDVAVPVFDTRIVDNRVEVRPR